MASFRSAKKIRRYLVRAKLYPFERQVGSFKCGGTCCQVCLNVSETETFTSTSTNKTYKINHEFNCNESSLIYLSTCKFCQKQYVGQTVSQYEGHTGFLENVSVIFIDKTDSQNPEKSENYWIHTLKTMVSRGLNILKCLGNTF